VGHLSSDFRVSAGGRGVTTVTLARFRDRGRFELAGVEYTVAAEGFLGRTYRLERGALGVARAEARGFLRPAFSVTTGDRVLTMRPRGFFGSAYAIEHGRTPMGEIRRVGALSRRATVELDERIEPACRIFLIFLAQVQWRRQRRRSG
jgi:hypothetical protein